MYKGRSLMRRAIIKKILKAQSKWHQYKFVQTRPCGWLKQYSHEELKKFDLSLLIDMSGLCEHILYLNYKL